MTERMTPWPFGKAGGEERESEEPSFGVLMGGSDDFDLYNRYLPQFVGFIKR